MTTTDPPTLPDSIVELAARALADYHADTDGEDRPQVGRYRAQAVAALVAALEGCDVHEERRVIGAEYGSHHRQEWLCEGDWGLVEHVHQCWSAAPSFSDVKVLRRYVITTPPEEVPDGSA